MILKYFGNDTLTLIPESTVDKEFLFHFGASIYNGKGYVHKKHYDKLMNDNSIRITIDEQTRVEFEGDFRKREVERQREIVDRQRREANRKKQETARQKRKAFERQELEKALKERRIAEDKRRAEAQAREDDRKRILEIELPYLSMASEIKDRLYSNPRNYKSLSNCSNFLMSHQRAGCDIADLFKKYAFFYDTGTGKTVMALEIMSKIMNSESNKFLVVCPKTIINTAWMSDCAEYYPEFKLLPLSRNIGIEQYRKIYKHWGTFDNGVERIYWDEWYEGRLEDRLSYVQEVLKKRADAYLINPEMFKNEHFDNYIKEGINGLIVDESSMLKNYSSVISQKVREFAKKMDYVYFLSGKPAPNRFSEYFSQMKVIDPIHLNMSYSHYIEYVDKTRDIVKLVDRKSITISKSDCLDLPTKTYLIRKVALDISIRRKYNEMEYAWRIEYQKELKEKRHLTVGHHLSALMKLRQIASGFIIEGKGKETEPVDLHNHKIDELMDILCELGDNQAIVWCVFKHDIEKIEKLLIEREMSVVTAYGGTKNKDESIDLFKNGKAQFIIANPKTLMYGVTLVNCTYAIYFSTSYSHEEYYQSHDRIYRIGQENPCTYIFLQTEDTIDEVMYDCVKNKRSRSEFFEELLKSTKAQMR